MLKGLDKYFSQYLTICFPINKINVNDINDIAFLFQKVGNYEVAELILTDIIRAFPSRVVAYLNLADAQWQLNEKDDAKKNYNKYVVLMKKQGKDLKSVPAYVYERM